MYACNCAAVTEDQVQRAISESEATSLEELQQSLGVASCCGCCTSDIEAMLCAAGCACAQ